MRERTRCPHSSESDLQGGGGRPSRSIASRSLLRLRCWPSCLPLIARRLVHCARWAGTAVPARRCSPLHRQLVASERDSAGKGTRTPAAAAKLEQARTASAGSASRSAQRGQASRPEGGPEDDSEGQMREEEARRVAEHDRWRCRSRTTLTCRRAVPHHCSLACMFGGDGVVTRAAGSSRKAQRRRHRAAVSALCSLTALTVSLLCLLCRLGDRAKRPPCERTTQRTHGDRSTHRRCSRSERIECGCTDRPVRRRADHCARRCRVPAWALSWCSPFAVRFITLHAASSEPAAASHPCSRLLCILIRNTEAR